MTKTLKFFRKWHSSLVTAIAPMPIHSAHVKRNVEYACDSFFCSTHRIPVKMVRIPDLLLEDWLCCFYIPTPLENPILMKWLFLEKKQLVRFRKMQSANSCLTCFKSSERTQFPAPLNYICSSNVEMLCDGLGLTGTMCVLLSLQGFRSIHST